MRWTMFILNLLAAVTFVFVASMLNAALRTHAYSTYRELVINRALVDKPTYTNGESLDVEARIRGIGGGTAYTLLGYLGAGACIVNGFAFLLSPRRNASPHG